MEPKRETEKEGGHRDWVACRGPFFLNCDPRT